MVKTNPNPSNTHIKHLLLSASVSIIIITTHLIEISRISIISCFTILPPVHLKSISPHQLFNYPMHGLEHSETDMNS